MLSAEESRVDNSDSHAQFNDWVHQVRNPAQQCSEGLRSMVCREAEAEYEIAPLSGGRFAMKYSLAYRCGDYWSCSTPWCAFDSRKACIEAFLEAAHRHFGLTDNVGKRRSQMNAAMTLKQQQARAAMHELLARSDLFGFLEPEPEAVRSPTRVAL